MRSNAIASPLHGSCTTVRRDGFASSTTETTWSHGPPAHVTSSAESPALAIRISSNGTDAPSPGVPDVAPFTTPVQSTTRAVTAWGVAILNGTSSRNGLAALDGLADGASLGAGEGTALGVSVGAELGARLGPVLGGVTVELAHAAAKPASRRAATGRDHRRGSKVRTYASFRES